MEAQLSLKLGTDKFGHTIYDEAEVLRLRNSGLGMRKIHNQTNIPKTTLHRIFKRNNIQTFPYRTKRWGNAFRIKERKRLVAQIFKRGSEARIIAAKVIRDIRAGTRLGEALENCGACPEIAIRWLKKTKSYDAIKWRQQKNKNANGLGRDARSILIKEKEKIKAKQSRSTTAALIKGLKNGVPIEVMARNFGINKSTAWNRIYKTKAYRLLRKRLKANLKYPQKKNTGFVSKKWQTEKEMSKYAHEYVAKKNTGKTILQEPVVWETGKKNRSGLRADFLIKEDNHIYELKQRCDPGSAKETIGQVYLYLMAGYGVSVIAPNDIYIPEYLLKALEKMKVELILI